MNIFDQERIDYAIYHKTAEKQILPICRKILLKSIEPTLEYVKVNGISTLPLNLINGNVWGSFYNNIYDMLGMKMARREFYRQRTIETLESEEKASAIDFLIDVWTTTLRTFSNSYTLRIQNDLNNTTNEIIQRALADTYELGLDDDVAVRFFTKDLENRMKERAKTISRTEATTISNLGKEIGARSWIDQQGGGGYKAWLGRNDDRERESHLEENNTLIPIDDLYNVGGELCERPGDAVLSQANRINCRCTQTIMSKNRYDQYLKRGRIVDGKLIGAS